MYEFCGVVVIMPPPGFAAVFANLDSIRRDGRVAEGAPLLREYTLTRYRGFESLSLRHQNSGLSIFRFHRTSSRCVTCLDFPRHKYS